MFGLISFFSVSSLTCTLLTTPAFSSAGAVLLADAVAEMVETAASPAALTQADVAVDGSTGTIATDAARVS